MWELGHEEDSVPKNWCFWTAMLEETLESPFECKEIKPVNTKGINPEYSLEGLELKLKLWPPDAKSQLIGKDSDAWKDWGQEKKGVTEDEMVRWHHWVNGHEFELTPGDGEGQGSLACCSSGVTKSRTQLSVWTTKWLVCIFYIYSTSHGGNANHEIIHL